MSEQDALPQPFVRPAAPAPSSNERARFSAPSQKSFRLNQLAHLIFSPPFALLALVTLVISRGITQGEFFFYYDEMTHAMNGAFFRDLILDSPWRHPIQYAYQYYAKYPAITFPHWPPLFHFIEGLFLLAFGLAPWVSRLAILCFALMGIYFWYRIAEKLGPRYRAFLSALAIACAPFILLYERVIMLEIPSLATCLASIYFWMKFQETERRRDLIALTAFVIASFLVSQKAIFLAVFIGLNLVVEGRYQLLKRKDTWLALVIAFLAILPWYVLALKTLRHFWTRAVGHNSSFLVQSWTYTFYLKHIYQQLGPLLLGLGCIGLVIALFKRTPAHRFLLTWIFAGLLCFTFIREKDPRHTMIWIPPLLYLAFVAIDTLMLRRVWGLVASSALAFGLVVVGFRTPRPIVSGPREVARYIVSQPESDIIYYQGRLNEDFIFFVRKFDPQKLRMVARDKLIVGRVNTAALESADAAATEQQVLNFFQTWGIRYAVVEDPDLFASFAPVHSVFYSPNFELVNTFAVYTNSPDILVRKIQIFRFRGDLRRTEQSIVIPIETIGRNTQFSLSHLAGRPWPN
jgi:Dolichyl-phosphate-mannose-protein mannosyltransferase